MAESKVLPFAMNDEALRRKIAEVATDSSKVFPSPHAKKRMKQRGVLRTQLLSVLRTGRVTEPAHRNIFGNWQCTLEEIVAGDRIKAVAALERNPSSGDLVIVITVMN